jgi:hypothetical protein
MGGLFLEFLTLMSEDREIERFFFIVIPAKAGIIHPPARRPVMDSAFAGMTARKL